MRTEQPGARVRIAISGSHRVGKTTLATALAEALAGYGLVPEPYHLLEEEGHLFAEYPSLEEFELQLERSCGSISESGADAIFDRCPLDVLGYLLTHRDADAFRIEEWLPRVREAVASLDLIAFVPIEEPDRVAVPRSQAAFRAEVDATLREIVLDDTYGLGLEAIAVEGTVEARVRRVLTHLPRRA